MEYNFLGISPFKVGWYELGVKYPTSKKPSYEDGKWYEAPYKYYNPYSYCINMKHALDFKRYKYSAIDIANPICPIKYLRLYKEFPQLEYLVKAGFHTIAYSKTILKKISKDKAFTKWLLKNKDIPLKILIGSAGTGKTFLSLAAGLEDTIGTKKYGAYYDKMLISRPATGFDEIGFMPGDLDEKLRYTNLSYFDNLSVILGHGGEEDRDQVKMQIEDLFEVDTIEVCGLSFIRGRSLINSYLICDEAQNAGASLIRDVISRAGYGTSVVLAGDPRQIDISTLDRRNNGLEYAASKMKGSPLCGIIRFPAEASVRSPLAKEAAERM